MQLDDEICYCYHVTMRKLASFSRRVRPDRASRMTECLGAGTGCGWCIPFLVRIAENPDALKQDAIAPEEYAERRAVYRKSDQPRHEFDSRH